MLRISIVMHAFSFLYHQFPNLIIAHYAGYQNELKAGVPKKELEGKVVSQLLDELDFSSTIYYKDTGQPFLVKFPKKCVSISHAGGWFAVVVNDEPIGIDIELDRPRILDGTDYFVNIREQQFLGNLLALHLVWGVKEAFYKKMEGNIPDLKNEVTLLTIYQQENQLEFEYNNALYKAMFIQNDGVTVVIA